MKISTLAAAAVIGAAFTFMAPSAEAMSRTVTAPVDITQTTDVEQVHGRHCRIRRGHRSRCRSARRSRHRHSHRHGGYRHRHRHYSGHHRGHRRYRSGRPRVGIYLGF